MAKRKQVKNACTNCQRACKKCDEGRPCSRCVKYGIESTCQDSLRKERARPSASQADSSTPEIPVIAILAAICSELYVSELQRVQLSHPQPQYVGHTYIGQNSNSNNNQQTPSRQDLRDVDHYRQLHTQSPLPRAEGILTPPVTPDKNTVVVFHGTSDHHLVATVVRHTTNSNNSL